MKIAGCLLMMGMIFLYPEKTADAARGALRVFGMDIVPTLFPYMVLTRMLITRLKSGSRSSLFACAVLGCLGGSPSGASMIQSLASSQKMQRKTAYALCALTGTISPIFLLNTVGKWLRHSSLASLLTISHFIGAALTALLVYLAFYKEDVTIESRNSAVQVTDENTILTCATSILGIGGCLVFYSVVSEVITLLVFQSDGFFSAFIHATLEISGGMKKLAMYFPQAQGKLGIVMAFSSGFSGLSILSQNELFLKRIGITLPKLIVISILRACFSAAVMFMLLRIYAS